MRKSIQHTCMHTKYVHAHACIRTRVSYGRTRKSAEPVRAWRSQLQLASVRVRSRRRKSASDSTWLLAMGSAGGSGTRAYSAASVVQRLHRELLALHAVSKSETAQLSTSSLTTTTTTTTTTASTSCEGFDSFIVRAYGACRLGATHVATLFEWLPGGSLSGLLERQVHVLSLVPTPFFGSHVSVSYSYESVSPSIPLIRFFPLDSTNQGKLSHAGARFYIGCAALGVAELHKLGIAHRDIKPANLVSIQLTRAP